MSAPKDVYRNFIVSLLLHGITLCCAASLWSRQTVSAVPLFQAGEFSLELGAALPIAPAIVVASLPPPAPELPPVKIEKKPEEPLEIEEVPEKEPETMQIASAPADVPSPQLAPTPPAPSTAAPSRSVNQNQSVAAQVSGAASAGLASTPQLDSNIHPVYPPSARLRGEEGKVTVRAAVTASGKAHAAEIVSSSGYPALDQAALDAVRRARFIPARNGRMAVESQTTLAFRFTLVD